MACSSGPRRIFARPKWHILAVLLLLYAQVLQIGLGGLAVGAHAADPSGFPSGLALCRSAATEDGAPRPAHDPGAHDGACCLAGCTARLTGGPLPSAGDQLAFAPAAALVRLATVREATLARDPVLHPLSARGPPLLV